MWLLSPPFSLATIIFNHIFAQTYSLTTNSTRESENWKIWNKSAEMGDERDAWIQAIFTTPMQHEDHRRKISRNTKEECFFNKQQGVCDDRSATWVTLKRQIIDSPRYTAYLSLIAKSERGTPFPLSLFRKQMVVIRASDSQNTNIHIPVSMHRLLPALNFILFVCLHFYYLCLSGKRLKWHVIALRV